MNPRAAINDLHPFQGCPFGQLGYFSKMLESSNDINCVAVISNSKTYSSRGFSVLQALF